MDKILVTCIFLISFAATHVLRVWDFGLTVLVREKTKMTATI